jgi:cell division protein FtsW (lipid II flippase)
VLYVALGIVCFLAAAVMVFIARLENRQALGFAGLLFTIAVALLLLAKITRQDARIRAIEDFLRVESSRERARAHDAGEPEPPEDATPSKDS